MQVDLRSPGLAALLQLLFVGGSTERTACEALSIGHVLGTQANTRDVTSRHGPLCSLGAQPRSGPASYLAGGLIIKLRLKSHYSTGCGAACAPGQCHAGAFSHAGSVGFSLGDLKCRTLEGGGEGSIGATHRQAMHERRNSSTLRSERLLESARRLGLGYTPCTWSDRQETGLRLDLPRVPSLEVL